MSQDPIELLHKVMGASKTAEMYHVTTFKGHRENALGETWRVTVEVWDAGPDSSHGLRYTVKASDEKGRKATGNGDKDLGIALMGVHWSNLDAPLPKK